MTSRVRRVARGKLIQLVAVLVLLSATVTHAVAEEAVVVFAAASLRDALDDVTAAWKKQSAEAAIVSYGASSALAKQIEQGAPADIFFSADRDWMDYLSAKDLIRAGTERPLLGNKLVLIAPESSPATADIKPGFDLVKLLGDGRLAICDAAVPAGKYGIAALQALGVWDKVRSRTAPAENVRAALLLVARGEAPLGIVYATDAHADPAVKSLGTFPDSTHPPIVYPVALVAASKNPAAAGLLAYIESDAARPLFERQGFTVLPAPGRAD
jgi:molybdate transport system substrate-binding protein